MRISNSILIILVGSFSGFSQDFVDDIKVGQIMPKNVSIGGYLEEETENCNCRIFSITYDVNRGYSGNSGAKTAQTIGIHFNEQDTVTGIINITLRLNNEDAQRVYISRLSEYLRTQSYFTDRKLLKVRDTNSGVVDGIYYYSYSYNNGENYKAIGVVEKAIVEETYLPNSSYEPRLID